MGEDSRTETFVSVNNPNNIMYERFNVTTFIDTDATTATVTVADEDVDFTSAEILQSLAVAKGTTYTKATLTSDSTTNVTFKMSADGGSHWESVTSGTQHTFTNTGTDLRYQVTASDTATIGEIKISYE